MSRAWVTTLAMGTLLLAGFGVVEERYWPGLATRAWWEVALVLLIGVYGACFAAVSFPRLLDPRLSIPALAWVAMLVYFVFSTFSKTERAKERNDPNWTDAGDDDSFGPGDDRKHMGRAWALFATLVALAMMAGSVALTRYFASHSVAAPAPTTTHVPPTPEEAPPTAPPVPKNILDVKSFPESIAFALPRMTDDRNAPNAGAKLLARYGAAKLQWSDVVIAKNETSLELAEKAPPQAWGKRLCASGTLARIEKQTVDGTELHSARLVTKSGDALEVFAVGSTGRLVKRKPARFCGVVTGRLDVAGKPATFAVGMFEITTR